MLSSRAALAPLMAIVIIMLMAIASPVAEAVRERGGGSSGARTLECAVCHAMAVEVQHELAKTANSTEVIELSRRPSSDLGRKQYQKGGRAIKYVDSEMRITDALQAACLVLKKSYRVQTVSSRRRLALIRTIGDRHPAADLEGVDLGSGGEKIHSMCEEVAEERERDFIEAIRSQTDLAGAVCFGGANKSSRSSSFKAPCGNARLAKCPPGEISLAADGSGAEPCWTCETGKFQPLSGATTCVDCAGNYSTRVRGSTSEQDCRAMCFKGSYGTGGVQPCEPCPLHTYQTYEGKSECVQCLGGKGTSSVGTSDKDECVSICGDGRNALDEGCDDGNTAGSDGCSADCKVEPGWECQAKKSAKGAKSGARGIQTCQRLRDAIETEEGDVRATGARGDDSAGRARVGGARADTLKQGGEAPPQTNAGATARTGLGGQSTRLGRRRPRPPPVDGIEPQAPRPVYHRMGSRVESLGQGTHVRVPSIDEVRVVRRIVLFYCVAVCCAVLLCVVLCGGVLQCVAVCCGVMRSVAVCCSMLRCVAVCCGVQRSVVVSCSVCTYVCVCIYNSIYIYICIYYIYTYNYAYILFLCIHLHMHIYINIYIYMYEHIYT